MAGFLSFLALAALLVAIPGPAATLTMKNAVVRGFGSALVTAAGVFVADLVWMTASVVGLTAVLVASEPAFMAVRIVGAVYLVYLGVQLLRGHAADAPAARRGPATRRRAFREGVLCDLSDPKTLLVFTSVIPQFLPDGHHVEAAALFGVAFAALGFASLVAYASVFAQVRRLRVRPLARRALLAASGVILIAFGIRLVAEPAE